MIAVEHKRGRVPLLDERFEAFDLRNYGDTQITLIRRAPKTGVEVAHEDTALSGQL